MGGCSVAIKGNGVDGRGNNILSTAFHYYYSGTRIQYTRDMHAQHHQIDRGSGGGVDYCSNS